MTTRQAMWHGTERESSELLAAVARNCACSYAYGGKRIATCAAHHMLLVDQRALDGLLFERRMTTRLQQEEWTTRLSRVPRPADEGEETNTHAAA